MSGVDKPNLIQTSVEVNRVKQMQKTEFRNIQGHIEIKQKENEERQRSRPVPTHKAGHKRIAAKKDEGGNHKNAKQKKGRKGGKRKRNRDKGNFLDIKA